MAWTPVQQIEGHDFTGTLVPSCQAVAGSAVAVGDVILLETSVTTNTDSTTLSPTVTDQLGNTYTRSGSLFSTPDGQGADGWWCIVTHAGTPTITYTPDPGTDFRFFGILGRHFTGSDASSTKRDGKAQKQVTPGTATDVISTTSMASQNNDLSWAGSTPSNQLLTVVAGTGYSASAQNSVTGMLDEWKTASGAGAATFTDPTNGGGQNFLTIGFAITPAGGGGGGLAIPDDRPWAQGRLRVPARDRVLAGGKLDEVWAHARPPGILDDAPYRSVALRSHQARLRTLTPYVDEQRARAQPPGMIDSPYLARTFTLPINRLGRMEVWQRDEVWAHAKPPGILDNPPTPTAVRVRALPGLVFASDVLVPAAAVQAFATEAIPRVTGWRYRPPSLGIVDEQWAHPQPPAPIDSPFASRSLLFSLIRGRSWSWQQDEQWARPQPPAVLDSPWSQRALVLRLPPSLPFDSSVIIPASVLGEDSSVWQVSIFAGAWPMRPDDATIPGQPIAALDSPYLSQRLRVPVRDRVAALRLDEVWGHAKPPALIDSAPWVALIRARVGMVPVLAEALTPSAPPPPLPAEVLPLALLLPWRYRRLATIYDEQWAHAKPPAMLDSPWIQRTLRLPVRDQLAALTRDDPWVRLQPPAIVDSFITRPISRRVLLVVLRADGLGFSLAILAVPQPTFALVAPYAGAAVVAPYATRANIASFATTVKV